jgi:hypothetical protein
VSASAGTLFSGLVIFGLAAFAPFVVLKLFPAAEAAIVAQGISRGPVRTTQQVSASAFYLERLAGTHSNGSNGAAGRAPAARRRLRVGPLQERSLPTVAGGPPAGRAAGPDRCCPRAAGGGAAGGGAAGGASGCRTGGAAPRLRRSASVAGRCRIVLDRTTDAARRGVPAIRAVHRKELTGECRDRTHVSLRLATALAGSSASARLNARRWQPVLSSAPCGRSGAPVAVAVVPLVGAGLLVPGSLARVVARLDSSPWFWTLLGLHRQRRWTARAATQRVGHTNAGNTARASRDSESLEGVRAVDAAVASAASV